MLTMVLCNRMRVIIIGTMLYVSKYFREKQITETEANLKKKDEELKSRTKDVDKKCVVSQVLFNLSHFYHTFYG